MKAVTGTQGIEFKTGVQHQPRMTIDKDGNISFAKTSMFFGPDTVDGADSKSLLLGGGGASGATRGATIELYGNENASLGAINLRGGNAGGIVTIFDGGGNSFQFTGGQMISSAANFLLRNTATTQAMGFWGGNLGDQSVGGGLTAFGSTHGTNPGDLDLYAANVAGGEISLHSGGQRRVSLDQSGRLVQNASQGQDLLWQRASTAVCQSVATGLTAAGTTISDALQLTAVVNNVTTAAASTGVKLFETLNTSTGFMVYVRNGGANAINVFPPNGSGTINGGSAGAAVSVASGAHAVFFKVAANTWVGAEMSAA